MTKIKTDVSKWWNGLDEVERIAVGVLSFIAFIFFLAWLFLFTVSPTAWLIVSGVVAGFALFIAGFIAVAILSDW